jgi:hypothetical protein
MTTQTRGSSDQVVENVRGFFPSFREGLGEGAKLNAHKPSPQPSPKGRGRKTSNLKSMPLRSRLFRILVQLCRFALAALFLFTAGAKTWIVKAFAANVSELLASSGFNPVRWMWPATVGVIVIEVVTAALLLIPKTVRLGALFAAALLIGFAGYALYYVYVLHGEPLECGCFGGIIASQLGVKTTLRNLALLVPVLIVFFGYRRTGEIQSQHDSFELSSGAVVK